MRGLIIAVALILSAVPALATIRYVDQDGDASWSGVDGESYIGSPGVGNGYATIQNAIDAMNPGDKIYLRGGVYQQEAESANADIFIPTTKNGDSWEEGHYSYMGSYPGEWAILDGEYSAPNGIIVGGGNTWSGCGSTYSYWMFEKLEFYRGTYRGNSSGGAGLQLRGGPITVRYCFFNDCFDDAYDNNPGGFAAHILHDSIIEYNYFYHNGWSGPNGAQIQLYTDYYDESTGYSDLYDIDCSLRKNIIRYNLFDGSDGLTHSEDGLKYKTSQMLTDTNNSYSTYQEYGDQIHHNIFINHDHHAIIRQDYCQFYKNIILGPGQLDVGEYHSKHRWNLCVYNNTLINANYNSWLENSPADPYEFNDFAVNNIFAHYNYANQPSYIFLWQWFEDGTPSTDPGTWIMNEVMNHNYVYDETSSGGSCSGKPIRVGDSTLWSLDSHFGCFEVSEYNSENSVTNYIKASSEGTDNLFSGESGALQFITRGDHSVATGVTIANGGISGNHPYLSGVTLPSYLGATNPDDSDWVAGVLALDASYMTSAEAGSDPEWIEGSTPAPAPPTLSFYLTNPAGPSGAAQGSPHNSLGGYRSTTQVSASAMKNLFDDVTVAESIVGDTEYRFLDVYNSGDSDATKVQVFVSSDTSSSGTEITLGYNSTNQPHEDSWDGEDVANEDTAPASPSLTFGTYTRASPLHLGTIPAGRSVRICVKRTVTAGVPWTARDVGTIAVRYLGD